MQKTAEIFMDGSRQVIRLPEDVHFPGEHVDLRQDDRSGDWILSAQTESGKQQASWSEFFRLLDEIGPVEEDFLTNRDPTPPQVRDILR